MMFRSARRGGGPAAFLALSLGLLPLTAGDTHADDQLARGEYLSQIMDCSGCHTPGALAGQPDMARYLGGSDIGFEIPGLGIFWPPNLTSDEATGLGSWSADEIATAVRTGVRPDGRELAPVMPWHAYSALTDDDALALATYIKTLPAVSHQVPEIVGGPDQATAPYLTVVIPGK
jgi:mono/diheme cytochrome c family protein